MPESQKKWQLLGNDSIMQQQKNCGMRCFLCSPLCIKYSTYSEMKVGNYFSQELLALHAVQSLECCTYPQQVSVASAAEPAAAAVEKLVAVGAEMGPEFEIVLVVGNAEAVVAVESVAVAAEC